MTGIRSSLMGRMSEAITSKKGGPRQCEMREQGCDDLILPTFSGFDILLLLARSGFVVDSLRCTGIGGAAAHAMTLNEGDQS